MGGDYLIIFKNHTPVKLNSILGKNKKMEYDILRTLKLNQPG